MGNMVWKLLGTGSAIVAGVVSKKVVTIIWKKAGRDTAIDPNNPDIPIGEAIAYAVLVGLAAGLAKTFTTRQAAAIYQRSAGHLPGPMRQEIEAELNTGGPNASDIKTYNRKRS